MAQTSSAKLFLATATLVMVYATSHAQSSPDSVLNTLAAKYPVEKVYIHYDKTYYVAGETIWFKAYLYSDGHPSLLSDNFYLQVLNREGAIIATRKYPVKGATVAGDVQLPDSLAQGYYTIRALTPWMLANSGNLLYAKDIYIFNPSRPGKPQTAAPNLPPLSLRFFPESGYLADGILSVTAFEAIDSSGAPVAITGTIKMDDSVTITGFSTYHDGIGKVQFKPQGARKYVAVVEYKGQKLFFPLPEVKPSGINLKVDDEKGGKVFTLSRTRKDKEQYEQLLIIAESGNRIVYENEIRFEDYYSVKGHLLTDSMPSGILHFTVFNNRGMPLAERLTFVDNGEYRSNASIAITQKGLTPRAENIVQVSFTDAEQRSCSVSVLAADEEEYAADNNIITSLLLTGDLKGYIRNPAYYFSARTDSVKTALDNLMLVQGWSRYSWNTLLSGEWPQQKWQDRYLISLHGTIADAKTKSPVSGGHLSLFLDSEDSLNQDFGVEVSKSGTFEIDSLLFRGKTKLFYGYTNANGKEQPVTIQFQQYPADLSQMQVPATLRSDGPSNIPFARHLSVVRQYASSSGSALQETKELDPVVVKSSDVKKRPIDEVNEKYSTGVFTAMGRVNIDNINQPEVNKSLSVYDFIRKSIQQVAIINDNFIYRRGFSLFDPISGEKENRKQAVVDSLNGLRGIPAFSERAVEKPDFREPGKNFIVAVFVNEHPTFANYLKTIRMDNVALVKFYEPGFIGAGGEDGPGGALAIYTKTEVVPDAKLDKLDHIVIDGYSVTREFYSPDYAKPQAENNPDTRTTLYWNPEIYTDRQSTQVNLRYFNNDKCQRMKLVFEGFDATGKLIHVESIITR